MAKKETHPIVSALVNAKFETSKSPIGDAKGHFCVTCMADNLTKRQATEIHGKKNHKIIQVINKRGEYCYKKEDIDGIFEGSGGFDASDVQAYSGNGKGYCVYYIKSRLSSEIRNEALKGCCPTCGFRLTKRPRGLYCSLECKVKCEVKQEELDKVMVAIKEEARILEMVEEVKRRADEKVKKEEEEAQRIVEEAQRIMAEVQKMEDEEARRLEMVRKVKSGAEEKVKKEEEEVQRIVEEAQRIMAEVQKMEDEEARRLEMVRKVKSEAEEKVKKEEEEVQRIVEEAQRIMAEVQKMEDEEAAQRIMEQKYNIGPQVGEDACFLYEYSD